MKSTQYYSGEKALTREEYEKILAACTDPKTGPEDRILILVGVGLGLRREDLTRVQIQNIDIEAGRISYQEKKKGNRIRTVSIGPKLTNELKTYILHIIKRDAGPLFSFQGRQAYNRFNALCDDAGIPRRPIHALRATCAKFCRDKGWSVDETAKYLGDTVTTIERHYTIPSMGEIEKAAKEKEII